MLVRLARALFAGAGFLFATANAEPPAVKLLSAPGVSPADAWSYYGSATTHTNGVAAWTGGRPPEIVALARTLGSDQLAANKINASAYAQNVFDYVRNNIDTEFRFGLAKGARGAVIDQSGTPFDQAHLMVELLRQGGVSASYQVGTITLDAQQFGQWTGLVYSLNESTQSFSVNAKAACQFLADGGIPVSVGSTSDCTALSSNLSTVTLGHIWVTANGNLYDPAFKRHTLRQGIDVAAAMGCGSSCGSIAKDAALQGATLSTFGGAPTVAMVNESALNAQLGAWAQNVRANIDAVNPLVRVEDVAGGKKADLTFAPTIQTSFAYAHSVTHTWTENIPDQFRSKVAIRLDANEYATFADELDGRILRTANAQFMIDTTVVGPSGPRPTGGVPYNHIEIDLPYAASSGAYGDDVVWTFVPLNLIDGSVSSMVMIWGGAGPGRAKHFSDLDRAQPPPIPTCNYFDPTQNYCPPFQKEPSDPSYATIAQWAYQKTLAKRLLEGLNHGQVTEHFILAAGSASSISARSWMSSSTATGDAAAAETLFQTFSIASAMVEGSVLQQASDSWLNGSITGSFEFSNLRHQIFMGVSPTNYSGIQTALQPYITSGRISTTAISEVQALAQQGWSTILTYGGDTNRFTLYPHPQQFQIPAEGINCGAYGGARICDIIIGTGGAPNTLCCELTVSGGTFLWTAASSSPLVGWAKGAAVRPGPDDPLVAVTKSIELQKLNARSGSVSASLASSAASLAPNTDVVTGAGPFPYSLPFQRRYDSSFGSGAIASLYDTGAWTSASRPHQARLSGLVGGGWGHNYEITAALSSDGAIGQGANAGIDASEALAGLITLQQLVAVNDFHHQLAGTFTANWIGKRFVNNVVSISLPDREMQFVRHANNQYVAPGAGSDGISVSGLTFDGRLPSQAMQFDNLAVRIGYDYSNVVLIVTDSVGGVLVFKPSVRLTGALPNQGAVATRSFAIESWTFVDGAKLSFDYVYQPITTEQIQFPLETRKVLMMVANHLGRTLTFDYDLGEAKTAEGQSLGVDGLRRLTRVTTDQGAQVSYGRNCATPGHNNITLQYDCKTFEVVQPDGSRTIYQYEPDQNSPTPAVATKPNYRLRRIFTPSDHTTPFQTIIYDELMRVKSVTNAAGEKTDYLPGGVSTERWKRGQSIDPLGNVSTAIFNEDGALTASIDPLGRQVRNEYDDAGRLVRSVQPAGNAEERKYDVRSNLTETCVIPKERWDQHCNSSVGDIVTKTTYVEGPTVRTCVNLKTCNKPATFVDAMDAETSYSWTSDGDLQQILQPLVSGGRPQTDYGYTSFTAGGTSFRLLTSITEKKSTSESIVSTFSYDASNKYVLQSATTDPSGLALTTQLTFDAIGNLTSVDGPRTDVADITTYQWDALRRPVIVTSADPDGSGPKIAPKAIVKFDADGLVNFAAQLKDDASWRGAVTQYDIIGRPKKTTRPKTLGLGAVNTPADVAALGLQTVAANDDFAETAYDAAGRTLVTTDPEGRKTYTVYDAAGQVERVLKSWIGNPDGSGGSTACTVASTLQQCYQTNVWSSNGKLLSVTNARGSITRYSYDGFDRLTRTSYPDCVSATDPNCAFTEVLSYDKAGNVLSSRNRAGQQFAFTYDPLSRLIRKAAPDRVETYRYDLLGLQTCAETWAGGNPANDCGQGSPITRITQAYDKAKRLTSEVQLVSGQTRTVGYQYADKVNRTGLVWPDAWRVNYGFDALNRLISVGADTDGNGSTDQSLSLYDYDALGQLAGIQRGAGSWGVSPVTATGIAWEPDGDLDGLTHTFNGEVAGFDYGYDRSAKLVMETTTPAFAHSPVAAQAISYSLGASGSVTDKLDQYASVAGKAAAYDLNGNRTSLDGLDTEHDSENRLVAASKGAMSVAYLYDAAGRRVMKDFASGGTDMAFVSAGDMEIAEYEGGALLRRYVPGLKIDDRVAMIEASGAISYYHPDRLGHVLAMTNGSGQVTDRYKYTPFGIECGPNLTCTGPGSSGNPYRYTGRRFDPETGLYHYRARYYDPSEIGGGRFLETDPVGYADQMNLYAYVANDPLNGTDPTGRCYRLALTIAGGAAVTDGPLPIGEIFGAVVLGGSCIYKLYRTMNPAEVATAGAGNNLANNYIVQRPLSILEAKKHEHHIVAQKAKKAETARENMNDKGIDPDDEKNKLKLDEDVHSKIHRDSYYDEVNERIRQCQSKGEICNVLDEIRKELENLTPETIDERFPRAK